MAASSSFKFSQLNQTRGQLGTFLDIFGVSKDAQKNFYSDMQSAVSQMGSTKDGKVKLSDGTEIDINSVAGMTVFTTHLQFLQANLELVNNIYNFIKTFESKLQNL
jgi:hypothetical protein